MKIVTASSSFRISTYCSKLNREKMIAALMAVT